MKIKFHFIIILITISVLSLAQQNEAFRVSYSGLELDFGLWLELEVTGIAVYKEHIQPVLNRSVPFSPLGIKVRKRGNDLVLNFPRPYMAAVVAL